MNFADICIRRPVLTLMLTLSLVVFGVLGYSQLGVDQFPNMEFPVVTVTAQLEGAAPEVMEEDVTEVLEEHLNTIGGLRSLRSTTLQGVAFIVVEFELDRAIDQAAQDVRDKVAIARRELPPELEPPVIDKLNPSNHPIIWLPLVSERPAVEVTEYLKYTVKPYIETIAGVASTELFGRRERAVRIWLDGDALRARGLAATDVIDAMRREHVDVPAGRVESRFVEYSLTTDAEFETVDAMADLIISHVGGAPVRLRDVARVEDGAEDPRVVARFNGEPAGGIGILKQSRGNTVQISDSTHERVEQLRPLLPEGMRLPERDAVIDFSDSIRESVAETQFALILGAVLAALTVLVFLRRVRPTLVVSLAIPLSIVATFFFMWMGNFTLNVMTLLALTLAVGVVIDDAIVVLENIERHRDKGEAPFEAASKGTSEIAFAATAATVSIAVVFLPVAFVHGIVGSFLGEFGLTVAASVMISLFVALTLTPMLAARIPAAKPPPPNGIYDRMERGFLRLEELYKRLLFWAVDHKMAVLGLALASLVTAAGFGSQLGAEFFPPSDEGRLFVIMETPPGTSLKGTEERVREAEKWMLAQPEMKGLFSGIGISGPDGPGNVNNGVFVAILASRHERERTAQKLMVAAREALGRIPGLKVAVFEPSGMFSGGRGELEFHIRGNLRIDELDRISSDVIRALEQRSGFVDLNKSLKVGLPEVRVVPDRAKAAALGVDARSIAAVVQATIGGVDIATFKEAGHRYDVRMRFEADERATPDSIGKLFVRTKDGGVVELRNLAAIDIGAAPSAISRHDRQRSVTISANLEGIPVAKAIEIVNEVAADLLPSGASVSFAGSAEAFLESLQQFGLAIGLAVLIIYMVLAAQFESLLHPLTVMLALPLAMVGALGALWAGGLTLNLFSLIGIILLMGLVTKNSILLVDFANQLRDEGYDKVDAMRSAGPVRLRPVLMTAISMIFGVLPAAIGVGPGAETRAPMAIATGAGMLSSTVLTLIVVPVFYIVLDDAAEWVKAHVFRRPRGRDVQKVNPPVIPL